MFVGSLTNDEIKHRVENIFAQFVSDVDPAPLSDWLIQEKVITSDQWEAIRHQNPTAESQCRALLSHLFSIQHPRAFLVVLQALREDCHYLLEFIDNQEPECGLHKELDSQTVVQGQCCLHFVVESLCYSIILYTL